MATFLSLGEKINAIAKLWLSISYKDSLCSKQGNNLGYFVNYKTLDLIPHNGDPWLLEQEDYIPLHTIFEGSNLYDPWDYDYQCYPALSELKRQFPKKKIKALLKQLDAKGFLSVNNLMLIDKESRLKAIKCHLIKWFFNNALNNPEYLIVQLYSNRDLVGFEQWQYNGTDTTLNVLAQTKHWYVTDRKKTENIDIRLGGLNYWHNVCFITHQTSQYRLRFTTNSLIVYDTEFDRVKDFDPIVLTIEDDLYQMLG